MGQHQGNVVAFCRRKENELAITVAPRLLTSLVKPGEYPLGNDVWGDTQVILPEDSPRVMFDTFTHKSIVVDEVKNGKSLCMAKALETFPVALLLDSLPSLVDG